MTPNPNTGFFDVGPGETITITVTATNTPYVASFPPAPSPSGWLNIQGPDGKRESRDFVAPASGNCEVVIVTTFVPDETGAVPQGARYDINVKGSAGGSFDEFPIEPLPLEPTIPRTYKFHVV